MEMIYMVSVFVSIGYLFWVLYFYRKHVSVYYILLAACITVLCWGEWQISSATYLETAILGNNLIYLAGCFVPICTTQCISEICHIPVQKGVRVFADFMAIFIWICVLTSGWNKLYYRDVELRQRGGISYLWKEYGVLHGLFPIYLVLFLGYATWIVMQAWRKKDSSHVQTILCMVSMSVNAGVYMIERLFGSWFEWLPVAAVCSFGILLLQLERVKMYDLQGFSGSEIGKNDRYGFVLFDRQGRFEGADDFARKAFPELNELRIDNMIVQETTPFLEQVNQWVRGAAETGCHQFNNGDSYTEARFSRMYEGKRLMVQCIRLRNNTAEQRYQKLMSEYNERLEREVAAKSRKIMRVQDDIIISMASIVENKDNNTGGHIQRTSDTVKVFVEHLLAGEDIGELTSDMAEKIVVAAPLHDLGKIAIPDKILLKPERFNEEEYEAMKAHSAKGANLVARILKHCEDMEFRKLAVNIANYHHERWDGAGYPEGLKAEEIPVEARIMALADVFDALVSKRVYKGQFSFEQAFGLIESGSGTQFDPVLCGKFLECREELEVLYQGFDEVS